MKFPANSVEILMTMGTPNVSIRNIMQRGLRSFRHALLAPRRLLDSCGEWHKDGYMNERIGRSAIKTLQHLNVQKDRSILDLGAFSPVLVEMLRGLGYPNSYGTDKNPDAPICRSPFGIQIDIFSPDNRTLFHVIHFRKILDYFRGGSFGTNADPSVTDLAKALYDHMHPGGHLIFIDVAANMREFMDALSRNGFTEVVNYQTPYHVWKRK